MVVRFRRNGIDADRLAKLYPVQQWLNRSEWWPLGASIAPDTNCTDISESILLIPASMNLALGFGCVAVAGKAAWWDQPHHEHVCTHVLYSKVVPYQPGRFRHGCRSPGRIRAFPRARAHSRGTCATCSFCCGLVRIVAGIPYFRRHDVSGIVGVERLPPDPAADSRAVSYTHLEEL